MVCLAALPLLAAPNGPWEIIRVPAGSGNNWVDVTERVHSLVQNDSLNFTVNSNTLGAASRRGRNRALRLQLQDNAGNTRQVTYRENQQVSLQVRNTYQGKLHINRAIYGWADRNSDVTSRLNSQIQSDQLNVMINNQNMGGDPYPDHGKTLTVQYVANGQNKQVVLKEGDTLRLPSGNNSGYGNLQINRAIYGRDNHSNDVTSRLNSQIQNDQLNVLVNNQNMGGDPYPDHGKTLTVQYAISGKNNELTLNEGTTLRLPTNNNSYDSLEIKRAIYGWENQTADVTSRLNSRVHGDQLNLQVTDDNMGGDPAYGHVKKLTVDYSLNGQNRQVVTTQNDTLSLGSDNGSLARRMNCESLQSENYGRKYCAADTRGGVRLNRTLSDSNCVQGSSWGYDDRGVWVDNGCRGEFILQGNSSSTGNYGSVTIPNGTELSVRTNEVIDSKTANVDQTYSAVVANDVLDNSGRVTVPKGSDARLVIRSASGGSITSASDLVLDVDSLTLSGTRYTVSTGDLTRQGGQGVGANKKTAIMVGGGAAVGTLIGAIVGGGKGAAIGAAIGAGAGAGTEVLTKGKQVRVPAETLLTFRLDQDLRLQAQR